MTYLEYFQLNEKPFKLSPDPRFMWFSEAHKEAWASLHFGVLDRRGFILLIGDVGTGKTTVINKLVQGLDENTLVAKISDPGLAQLDFFKFLAAQFDIKGDFRTKGEFLIELTLFLHRADKEGKGVVVIVDEAQRLSDEMLEEIRLLSNIERPDEKLINIILVGQNELNQKLLKDVNRALRQRITTLYTIGPLARNEVGDFIRFRLQVAGTEEQIFTDRAIRVITNHSKGNPRLINVICDQALLTAFVQEKRRVDEIIVQQCIKELEFTFPRAARIKEALDIDLKETGPAPAIHREAGSQKDPDFRDGIDEGRPFSPRPKPFSRALATGLAVVVLGLLALGAVYIYQPRVLERWVDRSPVLRNIYKTHFQGGDETRATVKIPGASQANVPGEAPDAAISEQAGEGSRSNGAGEGAAARAPKLDPDRWPVGGGRANSTSADGKALYSSEPLAEEPLDTDFVAPKPLPLPAGKTVIQFPNNSNEVSDDAFRHLNRLAKIVKSRPGSRLVITGYTDNRGDETYNRNLSKFRADVIKSYFVGQGIDPDQIKSLGLGSTNPISPNSNLEGRSENRRVEVELVVAD